jgi:hypothetical protein
MNSDAEKVLNAVADTAQRHASTQQLHEAAILAQLSNDDLRFVKESDKIIKQTLFSQTTTAPTRWTKYNSYKEGGKSCHRCTRRRRSQYINIEVCLYLNKSFVFILFDIYPAPQCQRLNNVRPKPLRGRNGVPRD